MLVEALASVESQTVPAERVEVVVDADDPLPAGWLDDLVSRFPRMRVRVQNGCGMAAALAEGLRFVETPYVAFLDSDDLWRPQKQEHQLNHLREDPWLDAVTCWAVNVTQHADGSTSEASRAPAAMFTATTFRHKSIMRFGPPDPSAGHYAWLYRWWAAARRAGIRTATADYVGLERRIHAGNSWVTDSVRAHRDLFRELRQQARLREAGRS